MASSITSPISFSGCDSHHKAICLPPSTNFNPIRQVSALTLRSKSNRVRTLSVSAGYRDGRKSNGSSDFVTGFLLGSAVFGTLAYVFAPQIRKTVLNENNEYGFKKPEKPKYYNQNLEEKRETLNEKINQLNSAIDNVSSRLRGGESGSGADCFSMPLRGTVVIENDSEAEATA